MTPPIRIKCILQFQLQLHSLVALTLMILFVGPTHNDDGKQNLVNWLHFGSDNCIIVSLQCEKAIFMMYSSYQQQFQFAPCVFPLQKSMIHSYTMFGKVFSTVLRCLFANTTHFLLAVFLGSERRKKEEREKLQNKITQTTYEKFMVNGTACVHV